MSQVAQNRDRELFQILVAVAWIDGEVQAEEQEFLAKIAAEHNIEVTEDLLSKPPISSNTEYYDLLRSYLGSNPDPEDYNNLLSAVSSLIYSDDDIATEEASLLNQIQSLDPNNSSNNSTFDKLLGKIQKLYQKGVKKV
ncbi:MAG: TerB family tellurite resistance protein [Cyanobacteria bacterium P01_G01_bin.19]